MYGKKFGSGCAVSGAVELGSIFSGRTDL